MTDSELIAWVVALLSIGINIAAAAQWGRSWSSERDELKMRAKRQEDEHAIQAKQLENERLEIMLSRITDKRFKDDAE